MTWLDDLTLETVIVHLVDDGPSIKGLKRSVYDDCLVLVEARVLEGEGMSKVLEGEIAIPREQVMFMQVLSS